MLNKNVIMPDLVSNLLLRTAAILLLTYIVSAIQCLVYFRVDSDKKLLGQNCISLVSLQPGEFVSPVGLTL